MEFRLLGPLEALGDDGIPVPLGGPRPRALLAQLLLEPNRAVSTDLLIHGIWGESPPASAPRPTSSTPATYRAPAAQAASSAGSI